MKGWRARLAGLMPAPLAAPESAHLRCQRRAVLVALLILAGVTLFWQGLAIALGILATALLIGLLVFLGVLAPLWLYAKWCADEAWLAELAERREGDDG
ncbi:MAG: hypothetical protein RIS94_1039 [Pseudomonadota bacterium]|jgi:hypothetical protein